MVKLPGKSPVNIEALLQNFQRLRALIALVALERAGGAAAARGRWGHCTFLAGNALPHCFVRPCHTVKKQN